MHCEFKIDIITLLECQINVIIMNKPLKSFVTNLFKHINLFI
jgi:hypothetical protein